MQKLAKSGDPLTKMKHATKMLFRKLGLDISIYNPTTSWKKVIEDRFDDVKIISHYLNMDNPIIIDGGAYSGTSAASYLNAFPKAEIHCFEPNPVMFKELSHNITVMKKRFPEAILNHYNKGLGNNNGHLNFYHYVKKTMSSFNKVNFKNEYIKYIIHEVKKTNPSFSEQDFIVDVQKIDIVTIDSFMEEKNLQHVNILKLDVEGNEIACLKGASHALSNNKIDIVFSEMIFTEVYLGKAMSFTEFEKYLLPNGYHLAAILHPKNILDSKKTIMLDVVYVSEKLFEAVT